MADSKEDVRRRKCRDSADEQQLAQFFYMDKQTALSTHATEVIEPLDLGSQNELTSSEINKEVATLVERGIFKAMRIRDLPDDANLLIPRFVLAIKIDIEGRERYKARYVVGDHRDYTINYLLGCSQTLQNSSCRPLLAFTSM